MWFVFTILIIFGFLFGYGLVFEIGEIANKNAVVFFIFFFGILFLVVNGINVNLFNTVLCDYDVQYAMKYTMIYAIAVPVIEIILSILMNNIRKKKAKAKAEKIRLEKIEQEKETQRQADELRKKERKEQAQKIYYKCVEHGVKSIDKSKNLDALRIVAATFNVNDITLAKELYEEGEKIAEEKRKDAEKEHNEYLMKCWSDDVIQCDKDKGATLIVGKDKYTTKLKGKLEFYQNALQMNDLMRKNARLGSNYQAQKTDWASLAGIANGLAGPVAGLETALDVQMQNEKEEIRAKQIREQSRADINASYENERNWKYELKKAQNLLDKIDNSLLDSDNIDEKFGMLSFSEWSYNLTTGGNIKVKAKITLKKAPKIINSNAALDGSIEIEAVDTNDLVVARGYYSAPGFDETNLSRVGFTTNTIEVLCVKNKYKNKIQDEITFRVKPISLWLIER